MQEAITIAGTQPVELDDQIASEPEHIAVSTMHLAKGLEFRAVVIMACDGNGCRSGVGVPG